MAPESNRTVQRVTVISPRLNGEPDPPARPRTITRPVSGPRTLVHSGSGPARVRPDSIASAGARARTDIQCWRDAIGSGAETVSFMPIQGCLDVRMSIQQGHRRQPPNNTRRVPIG